MRYIDENLYLHLLNNWRQYIQRLRVSEVQRLLFLLEAPEYCMRAFREHGVNGQDLLNLQENDLDDSRFKFPRPVQRKVLRIAEAWRSFQVMSGGPSLGCLSLDRFLDHHVECGRSPEALAQLQSAFRALDVNNNGSIGFEEYLVGYSLLLESAAMQPCLSTADLLVLENGTSHRWK
ncbi:hypothetical protein VOLCADRAFT_100498 [Volvox carteri f. nagariensis]|uniref:EF-hand domain-containing protein n=1 Tax=Volvox carteri f. nagariensis TaxID=3068 RepID=D8UKC1_VOLCA|nr:uncharacterized protein VOLCADRAFT_100498 [Volvox carteri f. nagariensis]EFJ39826.1 hypothetical protein VOLCADRAFT_100498 [Volvox carteri f. nagariensis]|eukprot:XP_002959098.1 hypothetical protein VOLCADRAFT_100498 [Volvox carteri f. nagariensis]